MLRRRSHASCALDIFLTRPLTADDIGTCAAPGKEEAVPGKLIAAALPPPSPLLPPPPPPARPVMSCALLAAKQRYEHRRTASAAAMDRYVASHAAHRPASAGAVPRRRAATEHAVRRAAPSLPTSAAPLPRPMQPAPPPPATESTVTVDMQAARLAHTIYEAVVMSGVRGTRTNRCPLHGRRP